MNFKVNKEDILQIGHTVFPNKGCAAFVCSPEHSKIEYILLRNILECFGEDCKIVDTYERYESKEDSSAVTDIVFMTNLSYKTYKWFVENEAELGKF